MSNYTSKELREAIESLCRAAGSYEDSDGDGWPVQASLEDGLLKGEVDNVMALITKEVRQALEKVMSEFPKETGEDLAEGEHGTAFDAGYNQAIKEVKTIINQQMEGVK
jgi:hypothetical protein